MRFSSFLLLCLFSFSSFSIAHVSRTAGRKNHPKLTDPAYPSALAAANRFLFAWQTQDHETGILMLTDSARQQVSRDQLQEFFSPGPDAAFEIQRGHKLRNGEYAFPAVLFLAPARSSRTRVCTIVITSGGKGEWAVDKLP
jgi:hypothetical protein